MKLRAKIAAPFVARFRVIANALAKPAAHAAAGALAGELQSHTPHVRVLARNGARNLVGSPLADDAAREFGTLDKNPQPWLAPSLPRSLGPMRAAVNARLRETIARVPAARANSRKS